MALEDRGPFSTECGCQYERVLYKSGEQALQAQVKEGERAQVSLHLASPADIGGIPQQEEWNETHGLLL